MCWTKHYCWSSLPHYSLLKQLLLENSVQPNIYFPCFTGESHLGLGKQINYSLMARWLVYCSMQICLSVRAQLVVLLIVACCRALQNKTGLDFIILCYKHLCLSPFVCSHSVMSMYSSSLGYCICLHAWANVSAQIVYMCTHTACTYGVSVSLCSNPISEAC